MSEDPEDDRVGYRRPPKATRFLKGQSGNPGGRPNARDATRIDAAALLDRPLTVRVNGAPREMAPKEIALRKVLDRALNRQDLRAADYLLELFVEHGAIELAEQGPVGLVAIMPHHLPMDVGIKAANTYGAPPWSNKQLAPIKAAYLAPRSERDAIRDDIMEYDL